jgi:hypothetical protein
MIWNGMNCWKKNIYILQQSRAVRTINENRRRAEERRQTFRIHN